MKNIKSILALGVLAAGGAFLASCNNDLPTFSDKNAFVAFTSSTAYAEEDGGEIEIAVMLTSLHGMDADVEFEVVDSTAKEGEHFTFEGEKVLHFTKDESTQYIKVKIIDNDVYGGNVAFTINLKASDKVNLGASKVCTVRINDNEHPLLFLFNNYTGSVTDFWGDSYTINGSITRDEDDDHVVWFNNVFTPWFSSSGYAPNPFYGVVNDEKTEILVPAGQSTGYSSSGNAIVFYVVDSEDFSGEAYDSGYNLRVRIEDNGEKLVIENAWGCSPNGSSWFELNAGNVTLTKQ